MPNSFNITASTNTIRLDDTRQAQTTFTVFNNSGRPIRGRARVSTQDLASESWITLVPEAERNFPIAGTHQYDTKIAVPAGSAPGNYTFRLDMVGTENPDEEYSQGPSVTFEVPVPPVKKPFPIWIPIVVVVALLVVGGVIAFLTTRGDDTASANATATATAITATALAQVAADHTSTALASQVSATASLTVEATETPFSYDLIARANTATWNLGASPTPLAFPDASSDEADYPYVKYIKDRPLTDGFKAPRVLFTHPSVEANGKVSGCYSDVYSGGNVVQATDHITGRIGFLAGAGPGGVGDVTFRIILLAQGVKEREHEILNVHLTSNKNSQTFDVPLGLTSYQGRSVQSYLGHPVDVCLQVDAGPSPDSDWATWIDVKITR